MRSDVPLHLVKDPPVVTPRPILIIEDDAALRATLAEQLALDGSFAADTGGECRRGRGQAGRAPVPGSTPSCSMSACPMAMAATSAPSCGATACSMPVIMLTGHDAEPDVVRGLDAGANDYIAKPFRAGELLARVRAQLRVFDNARTRSSPSGPTCSAPPPSCCWSRRATARSG